ncbi:Na+/H+ antiporter NhaC family protein [soil metagenome]
MWISVIPPVLTIAFAIYSKKIIPSLIAGFLIGCFLLDPSPAGGFESAISYLVSIITDKENLQVFLFLYLFSGLIAIISRSGGIKAFSDIARKMVKSPSGVFYLVWALLPVTFIDCGFRVIGAGSITKSLAQKNNVSNERLAFMLNNTASPVVELIPIATTFIGFNISIIKQGLNTAGINSGNSAYSLWLKAIPFEFFSIVLIIITFVSIFFQFKGKVKLNKKKSSKENNRSKMEEPESMLKPKIINFIFPLLALICLCFFFFWYYGNMKQENTGIFSALTNTEPNKAMLISLFITLILSAVLYFFQKYNLKSMTKDIITGGNGIMTTLIILVFAWCLAAVSQDLGLGELIKNNTGSIPGWSLPVLLFLLSSSITYFIGSGWGAASLIMPIAIPLASGAGIDLSLCIAAVITGGTFGDVTSPVAGMTNMASNVTGADHTNYLNYAVPYNFSAAAISAILFLFAGFIFHS